MKTGAGAVIATIIGLAVTTAANAAVYHVTDQGLVEVGAPGQADDLLALARPKAASAVGARSVSSRALPEPGVFLEQAGLPVTVAGGRVPTTNLRDAYGPLIAAAAEVYQVDENLLRAVVWQESRFNHRAVSRAGAKGLMQLMPATAASLRVTDVYDPVRNVAGGARYLRDLLQRYGGNPELALAAYNAGAGAVRRYQGIPPYRETQSYIAAIRSRLEAAVAARR